MATTTAYTIPMSRSTAAVFGRRRRRSHCKVAAVATSPPPPRANSRSDHQGGGGGGGGGGGKKQDYYEVLSLQHSAAVGAEEIKRAYRRLALRHHPDVCPPSRRAQSTELFLELRRAYETLSDPAERLRYDAELVRASGDDGATTEPGAAEFVARDVWEAQLWALRARSDQRQKARSRGGVHGHQL